MIRSMPPSINLSYDLARMSDAQLAERLERTWQTHARAEAEARLSGCAFRPAVQSDIRWLTRSSHG
jgi:hypothetical protein